MLVSSSHIQEKNVDLKRVGIWMQPRENHEYKTNAVLRNFSELHRLVLFTPIFS